MDSLFRPQSGTQAPTFLYADDSKIFKHICTNDDIRLLQEDIDNIKSWFDRWMVTLNTSKCQVVAYSYQDIIRNEYYIVNRGHRDFLKNSDSINDLGVLFDSKLKFDQHINVKVSKAYSMLGIIRRNFKGLTAEAFIYLYKSLVRSVIEYANVVWSPYRISYIEEIEKVQMRATKLVYRLKNLSYEDRLKTLNLYTLKYRRLRGDMIEVFKFMNRIYDTEVTEMFELSNITYTRGNCFKLKKDRVHYNMRKYFFTNRVIALWNNLPDYVVAAPSIDTFKQNLDKFWLHQEVKFNWKAEITGTGGNILSI